ncbi:hypothetical protein ACFLUF_01115 [Chloroflexota bacterium]
MPIKVEIILRFLLAAAIGAIIDYQRERAGKAAGLRTDIFSSRINCTIPAYTIW